MNKTMTVLFSLIVIIALSGAILLLSQTTDQKTGGEGNQINNSLMEDANQTVNVKIADFKSTSNWGTPGGVMAAIPFNITLQNLENTKIGGLTLEVKMLNANNSQIQTETMFYGPGIIGNGAQIEPFDGVLHAREIRTMRGGIVSDWGTMADAWALGNISTIAYVKLHNETIDEWKFTP